MTIDWETQWQTHALHFSEGFARIPIPGCSHKILLKPGPGFGDLSHPTTRLVISLMKRECANAEVLDVGCGSGILSFIAYGLGAKKVYGIDIDPSAIVHAQENALLNGMKDIRFMETSSYLSLSRTPQVLLINMIRSEQKMAWSSLTPIHNAPFKILASGILKEEEERYIKECSERNWRILEKIEEDGWLAFVCAN